jgi:hypothetical protein
MFPHLMLWQASGQSQPSSLDSVGSFNDIGTRNWYVNWVGNQADIPTLCFDGAPVRTFPGIVIRSCSSTAVNPPKQLSQSEPALFQSLSFSRCLTRRPVLIVLLAPPARATTSRHIHMGNGTVGFSMFSQSAAARCARHIFVHASPTPKMSECFNNSRILTCIPLCWATPAEFHFTALCCVAALIAFCIKNTARASVHFTKSIMAPAARPATF